MSSSLGLALIFRHFLRQLLSLLALHPMTSDEKTAHLVAIDTLFVATVLVITHRAVFRAWIDEMLLLGICGMCHVSFLFFAVGNKCVSLLYLFAFMVAIGPVFSICVIVEREMPRSSRVFIFLSAALCLISPHTISFPMVFSVVCFSVFHLIQLIEGQISLDEDLRLLRRIRRKLRLRQQAEHMEQSLRNRNPRVHHFPKTVSIGLYRNDGQARCHPLSSSRHPAAAKKKTSSYRGFEIVSH